MFVGGAVIQWLRDEMRFFSESRDAEYYAGKVKDTGGVYLVPAFTGLGAPHWDMYARGCLIGLTRGTTRELKPDWVQAWMAQLNAATSSTGGKKPAVKKAGGKKNTGRSFNRKPERIPDPMLSTVNSIASGSRAIFRTARFAVRSSAKRPRSAHAILPDSRPVCGTAARS